MPLTRPVVVPVAAAGLVPEGHLTAGGTKWNKQRIIVAIRARKEAGKDINHTTTQRDDCALVSAAQRYFGNWSKALAAAGVDAEG